jgi:hypothetical protein
MERRFGLRGQVDLTRHSALGRLFPRVQVVDIPLEAWSCSGRGLAERPSHYVRLELPIQG